MYAYKAISLLLLGNIAGALRTCVDVQETLIACVVSSDLDPMVMTGQEDVHRLCWHVSVMLECVAEARDTCPNLPILNDAGFARAITDMEEQSAEHCQPAETSPVPQAMTTSTSMPNDEPTSCDPLAAMTLCNDLMTGVTPGDVKAMCIPGEAYLACMTSVATTCPDPDDLLPFDLQEAISTTRDLLQQECGAVWAQNDCREEVEKAKQSCAYYLSDGSGEYCRSLELYQECLQNTLSTCHDHELEQNINDQYRHQCTNQIGGEKCPDDIQGALIKCTTVIRMNDIETYCRSLDEYFICMNELKERCANNSRFASLSLAEIERNRQDAQLACSPLGNVIVSSSGL